MQYRAVQYRHEVQYRVEYSSNPYMPSHIPLLSSLGWGHIEKIVVKLMRKYIVGRMSPANKKILAKRQLVAKDVRGANAPKKWLEINGSEKIKDVQGWLVTRSWYEFEGLHRTRF